MRKIGLLLLALIIALGCSGVAYASWNNTLQASGTVNTGSFEQGFIACSTNDPPGTIDPGKPQDVASTVAQLACPENGGWRKVLVTITNAYPCYYSEVYFTLKNHGTTPARIASITITNPPELTVAVIEDLVDVVLKPCATINGTVSVHVEQIATPGTTYTFTIEIKLVLWCLGGTPGYWQNWPAHHSPEEVTAWLQAIDTASDWLVPDMNGDGGITYEDWDLIRDAGTGMGATAYYRFIMHYCATRLNVEAGRLTTDISLDISYYDPMNWLGVSNIHDTSLGEVIAKIEDKYPPPLSKEQFNIMKNICVAFNQLGGS